MCERYLNLDLMERDYTQLNCVNEGKALLQEYAKLLIATAKMSSRSPKRTAPMHEYIAEQIKTVIRAHHLEHVYTVGIEQKIPTLVGGYKKCDIVVFRGETPYIAIPCKFPIYDWTKNRMNYLEQLHGVSYGYSDKRFEEYNCQYRNDIDEILNLINSISDEDGTMIVKELRMLCAGRKRNRDECKMHIIPLNILLKSTPCFTKGTFRKYDAVSSQDIERYSKLDLTDCINLVVDIEETATNDITKKEYESQLMEVVIHGYNLATPFHAFDNVFCKLLHSGAGLQG